MDRSLFEALVARIAELRRLLAEAEERRDAMIAAALPRDGTQVAAPPAPAPAPPVPQPPPKSPPTWADLTPWMREFLGELAKLPSPFSPGDATGLCELTMANLRYHLREATLDGVLRKAGRGRYEIAIDLPEDLLGPRHTK